MSAIVMTKKTGPATYIPADNAVILGGQVVASNGADRIVVAGANSAATLGIAVTDGKAPEDVTTSAVNGILDAAQLADYVTVAYGGIEVDGVTYAANTNFGDRLKAAANGKVTPMVAADDPMLEVGTCTKPGGVLANATGLVRTK